MATGATSNIFILFTASAIIQIGCLQEQIPKLREVLKYRFRPCSGMHFCLFSISDWCMRLLSEEKQVPMGQKLRYHSFLA